MIAKRTKSPDQPFWRTKKLSQMTAEEWESVCDGCGKCCLHKLQFENSRRVQYTNVACRLLDLDTCRCSDYPNRRDKVPDCVQLTAGEVKKLNWLPTSCAYRVLAAGGELPWWHHLVSGDRNTIHEAGHSVRGRVVAEKSADILEHHIVTWPR
jgi:uncharacterized cysteine cluster protein YcgN (CxxCxxCC family)